MSSRNKFSDNPAAFFAIKKREIPPNSDFRSENLRNMTWKLKFSRIALLAILCSCLFGSAAAQKMTIKKSSTGRVSGTSETRGNLSDDEFQIHYLINNERRKKGLSDLYWDEDLARIARAYSRKMAKESFFSHYDRDGNSIVERAKESNVRGWNKIGENLFFCEGYDDFDALAVRGWMNSTDHRRNILDRQFTGTGIGIATTRDGRIYITQVFIRA